MGDDPPDVAFGRGGQGFIVDIKDPAQGSGAGRMRFRHPLDGGWKADEGGGGPDGPPHQFTPAVRADAGEPLLCAGGAERAFEGADTRLAAIRSEIDIAALAVWAEF